MYKCVAIVLMALVGLAVSQYSSHAAHGRSNPCPDNHNHDYCFSLRDGTYWDPWNPYCGYIDCSGGVTYWRSCPAALRQEPLQRHVNLN
ncbi:unnamed protein product [Owenia fusiformis]|uniref:Uncharacterized protein n=1 Tax=Owenia fusiformis TaxID=6347 RepID=A0A8J1XRZ0_OWEFU|nr:unnamed protein product [Owenia fusiformis]